MIFGKVLKSISEIIGGRVLTVPTNLPPEAKHKWVEASAAKNPILKLRLLQEFLSLVPKHKGTARLCVQVKKQMATLRREKEEKKRRRVGKGGPRFFVEKEGAAQVALIGLANAGKSSLLAAVSNAKATVSPTAFTTRRPEPGMLGYKDIQFQILDSPSLMKDSADGRAWGLQTLALARNADCLVLMVDLTQDSVGQLSLVLEEMKKARILVSKPRARVEVERKFMGAGLKITVMGRLVDCTFRDVEQLLKSYRIMDAVVKVFGEATLYEVEDAIYESTVYKPAVVVANKTDLEGSEVNLKLLETHVGRRWPIITVSCKMQRGLDRIGEALYRVLEIMRVYTKEPGEKEFSKRPFILKKDGTVYDLARNIHSDFSKNFSFAKVWSKRLVFSPQKVGSTFVLEDGDVVEIHMK